MNPPAAPSGYRVIDEVLRHLDIAGRAPFSHCAVLAVQHVHSSLVALVTGLRRGGGDSGPPVTVIGKAYSTRQPAVAALRELGVNVRDQQRMSDPRRSYEEELDQQVEQALLALEPELGDGRTLLVIDEGAVATRVLMRRPDLATSGFVVEQTTRGARWTESAQVPFPVVDVARSPGKAELEGPLVADSMVSGLLDVLPRLPGRPSRLGVVGYGRMGARLARLLSSHFQVAVHDVDDHNTAAAVADGFPVSDVGGLLDSVDLLLGCTGTPIIDDVILARVGRSLTLVNAASSDIEFALWSHRGASAILPGSSGDAARPWLNHYSVSSRYRHVLAAGGFPINFHAPGEPIAPHDFQVTRALMLAGAAQVLGQQRPGIRALDASVQRVIADAYRTTQREVGVPIP